MQISEVFRCTAFDLSFSANILNIEIRYALEVQYIIKPPILHGRQMNHRLGHIREANSGVTARKDLRVSIPIVAGLRTRKLFHKYILVSSEWIEMPITPAKLLKGVIYTFSPSD